MATSCDHRLRTFSSNTVLIFVIGCTFLLFGGWLQGSDGARLQLITLYSNDGLMENYTDDVADLTKVSRIVQTNQLESICSQAGVWAFFTSAKYTDSSSSYGYHPATPQWSCAERRVSAYMTFYKSIRRLGNADLDESGISLFSEPLFSQDEIYFDGEALTLPASFHMNSFGFTGTHNWTIFSSPNFSGDALCLCSENGRRTEMTNNYNEYSGSGTSGVTFEERLSFRVGSLRKSCYGSQVWLVNGEFIRPREVLNSSVIFAGEVVNEDESLDGLDGLDGVAALKLQTAAAAHSYEPTLSIAGHELNLPFPIKFANFTAQLDSVWRIYAQVGFRGSSVCIRGIGTFNSTARVGSIRAGCNETETETAEDDTAANEVETTTDAAHDLTTLNSDSYTEYDVSTEHARLGQPDSQQELHRTQGEQEQGHRKLLSGHVTSTLTKFSVSDLDSGTTWAPAQGSFSTGFDESLDGLPLPTPRYWTTEPAPNPPPSTIASGPTPEYMNASPSSSSTPPPPNSSPNSVGRDRDSFGRNLRPFSTAPTNGDYGDEVTTSADPNHQSSVMNLANDDSTNKQKFYNTTRNGGHRNQAETEVAGGERLTTSDSNSIFFTGFIITLILLLLSILLAIGVFIYFRSTRQGRSEVKPIPSSAAQSLQPE